MMGHLSSQPRRAASANVLRQREVVTGYAALGGSNRRTVYDRGPERYARRSIQIEVARSATAKTSRPADPEVWQIDPLGIAASLQDPER